MDGLPLPGLGAFGKAAEETKEAVEDGEGMGRASGYEKIDGDDGCGAIESFRVIDVGSAGNGAGADGDDNPRLGRGVPGFFERQLHVARNASGDEQSVGMAGRGDVLDAKSAEVPAYRAQDVGVGFAAATTAGADDAQTEGTSKELAHFLVEGGG